MGRGNMGLNDSSRRMCLIQWTKEWLCGACEEVAVHCYLCILMNMIRTSYPTKGFQNFSEVSRPTSLSGDQLLYHIILHICTVSITRISSNGSNTLININRRHNQV